jgi:Coenzyme PQQ synthesis protein D (PqqD)
LAVACNGVAAALAASVAGLAPRPDAVALVRATMLEPVNEPAQHAQGGELPAGALSASASVRLRPDVAWREIDGEIVLLDVTGAAYYSVTRSGLKLWPSVVQGCTVDQLVELLTQAFSLDRRVAERDARSFLQALDREGLLEASA